jgi:deoxycytidylate deaminase
MNNPVAYQSDFTNRFGSILGSIDLYENNDKRYHHVAFLIKGSRKINVSTNIYERTFMNGRRLSSVHAEMNVTRIIRSKDQNKKGLDILVVRINKSGSGVPRFGLCESMPCGACVEHLKNLGFKRIYYSDHNGNIQKVKLSSIRKYYTNSWLKVHNQSV